MLRGKFCKRAEDHLLGLHEGYLHFVWGGPGLQLVKLVWAVFQYGVEGWSLKKSDRNRIEAFKMWCWLDKRLLYWPVSGRAAVGIEF